MSLSAELALALAADEAAGHSGIRMLRLEDSAPPPFSEAALVALSFDSPPLLTDLLEWSRRTGCDPALRVQVCWEKEVVHIGGSGNSENSSNTGTHFRPPFLRIVCPLLDEASGGSGPTSLGVPMLPALLREGWSPAFRARDALHWLHEALAAGGARVALDTGRASVPLAAAVAVRARLCERSQPSLAHGRALVFNGLRAVSSTFARGVLGLDTPPGFDAGNRVLAPATLLHAIACGGNGGAGVGGGGAGLVGAGLLAVSDVAGDDTIGNLDADAAALVFELTAHLPFPSYVGVAGFTVPHGDLLVLPAHLFRCLAAPEGTACSLRRVRLPPIEAVVLQPHSSNIDAVQVIFGTRLRAFLERSLTRYASLSVGDVLLCDGGPPVVVPPPTHGSGARAVAGTPVSDAARQRQLEGFVDDAFAGDEDDGGGCDGRDGHCFSPGLASGAADVVFRFTVVDVKPGPAAALWTSFSGELKLDILPSMDSYIVVGDDEKVPMQPSEATPLPRFELPETTSPVEALEFEPVSAPAPAAMTTADAAARRRAMAEAARRRLAIGGTGGSES